MVDNVFCETATASIYYIIFPVVLTYVHIDGRIHIDTVFQAIAWYSVLKQAIMWYLSDGIVFLCEAVVSIMRVQVPVSVTQWKRKITSCLCQTYFTIWFNVIASLTSTITEYFDSPQNYQGHPHLQKLEFSKFFCDKHMKFDYHFMIFHPLSLIAAYLKLLFLHIVNYGTDIVKYFCFSTNNKMYMPA